MWVNRSNLNKIRGEKDIALREMKNATTDDDFAYHQGLYEAYDMVLHIFAGKTKPIMRLSTPPTQGD